MKLPPDTAAAIIALPCAVAEEHVRQLAAHFTGPLIAACKGLHPETLQRTDEMLANHVSEKQIAILSGPSFAPEVARGQPTAITLAAPDIELAGQAASLFDDTSLRVYTCTDVIGVTLGGALKNVIAIAAGIASGLQPGTQRHRRPDHSAACPRFHDLPAPAEQRMKPSTACPAWEIWC